MKFMIMIIVSMRMAEEFYTYIVWNQNLHYLKIIQLKILTEESIDHKEIDEKTTENDNGSSDEKVEGGEEENSKTKVISKSGEHNIEIDETLTENLMMKEKEKKIPKLRQFLIQMNK